MLTKIAKETEQFLSWWYMVKAQQTPEERLTKKLSDLMAGLEKQVIARLLENKGAVAGSDLKKIVKPLTDSLETFSNQIVSEAEPIAELGRKQVMDTLLQSKAITVGYKPFSTPVKERLIAHLFEASELTMERIVGDVMANITNSYNEGLGIDDAANRLQEVFVDLKGYEAKRIARTEINGAQQWGAEQTVEQYASYKQWIASEDERVRGDPNGEYPAEAGEPSHYHMHGQVVKTDEDFTMMDGFGMPIGPINYPGDRAAPIAWWINDRCRVAPYIPAKGEVITQTPYYPDGMPT